MSMCSMADAIKYIEDMAEQLRQLSDKRLADMPERIVRRLKYLQAKDEGVVPKYYKANRSIYSYWKCGNCGGRKVDVSDNYCPNCGYYIKWDNPRCLTGYDDPADEPGEKEAQNAT